AAVAGGRGCAGGGPGGKGAPPRPSPASGGGRGTWRSWREPLRSATTPSPARGGGLGWGHPRRSDLPDPHPLLGRDPQPVAFLHVECVVPRVDVAQRRERSDVAGRMGAVDQLLAQRVVAPQGAPDLGPAQE